MFRAALFTITKKWKQSKHPSTDEQQTDKMQYILTMEYYSQTKINKVLMALQHG